MPQDLPTDYELLEAVVSEVSALRAEVEPEVARRLALISHVVRIVSRNLARPVDADASERARLESLLDMSGEIHELNTLLAERIREKRSDASDPEIRAHLRLSAEAKVSIAAPRHVHLRRTPTSG